MEQVETDAKPWRQLGFVLGEAVLALISSGVLFVFISRFSGPVLLGTYALAFAWLMLFQGASSFGIPEFIMREVGARGRDAADQAIHAIWLGLGCGTVAMCIMIGASRLLGYSADVVEAIDIASLALTPTFLNIACRSVFLAFRQMQLSFVASFVEVSIVMSASIYLVLSGHGANALMVSLVVSKLCANIVIVTLLFRYVLPGRLSFDPDLLVRTTRTVFAFGVGNVLGMLTMRINTIMVSVWVNIATVGQFAAATKIMEIGLMIPNLFAQFLMTRIAHNFNTLGIRDPNRFGAWYELLFSFVVPASIGGAVFAEPILKLLFGPGFAGGAWVLRILMVYLLIEAVDATSSVILKAAQLQREDVVRLSYNPLTNIALNFVLLPTIGTVGAAIGRVAGVAVSATLRNHLIATRLVAVSWFRYALKPVLISGAVAAACSLLFDDSHAIWAMLLYGAVTVVLLRLSSSLSPSAIKDMMSTNSA